MTSPTVFDLFEEAESCYLFVPVGFNIDSTLFYFCCIQNQISWRKERGDRYWRGL